jgi:hypothetical protein
MAFTEEELDTMTKIVNGALGESDFKDLSATKNDFDPSDVLGPNRLVCWKDPNDNPITKILGRTTKNRFDDRGQFYHFKSIRFAKTIIVQKEIQVSNLLSNQENDFAEYSEFFKRLGLFEKLIPKNYCEQRIDSKINLSKSKLEEERENIFILCFTKDGHNELFWERYALGDSGVCLGFKFSDFALGHLYYFRDVVYDNGYKFDFLNHINYHLDKSFGRQLFLQGINKFSKFYKRGKYQWENETRLVFDYAGPFHTDLENYLKINSDASTGRRYIKLPLVTDNGENSGHAKNPFFSLTIDEVICGRHVSIDDFRQLEESLKKTFPSARIWKRL